MIVVTGGAGFIGSNLVRALCERHEVLVVDDLTDGDKFRNLVGCRVADYLDRDDFLERFGRGDAAAVEAVVHQGACTVTTERDGRSMMRTNFEYSKRLLHACAERRIPLVYASSASVYGGGRAFREERACEGALNVYAWSKQLFDDYVRRVALRDEPPGRPEAPVVGLRYFNVYGPREAHKGAMASVAYHFDRQVRASGRIRLFSGSGGRGDGEQRRDFVHVDDVVAVVRWFLERALERSAPSGIYNVGTGHARSFNELAAQVIRHHGRGAVEYVPFPEALRVSYQSYTEADLCRLRAAGYDAPFRAIEEGVASYCRWLDETGD